MVKIGDAVIALTLAITVGAAGLPSSALAREQRIAFASGTSSAAVSGSIKGYDFVDYLVAVKAGQVLTVTLSTPHRATYFNVLEPGQSEVAIHVGQIAGNRFEATTAKSGDYRIRVYMMRSAARRGETARFRLQTSVAGAVQLPLQPGDALVPGAEYNATGQVACSFGPGKSQRCFFGVKREGGGTAFVTITRPNGINRLIYFRGGKAEGYDKSQADSAEFSAYRHEDSTVVRVGGETYVIPDAVVFGG